MRNATILAVVTLAVVASVSQGKDYVESYVIDIAPRYADVKGKGPNGKELTIRKLVSPRQVLLVVKRRHLGADWLAFDHVHRVPEQYEDLWAGVKNGKEVKLPPGWESWRQLEGSSRTSFVKEVNRNGERVMYHPSPKDAGIRVRFPDIERLERRLDEVMPSVPKKGGV